MKHNESRFLTLCAALLLCLTGLAVTGCNNSGTDTYKQSMDTSESLLAAAEQIQEGTLLIDEVMGTLNGMISSPAADMPQQFQTFQSQLSELSKTADSVSKKAQKMFERGDSYFAAWEEQLATINNTSIRETSAERKEEVARAFNKVATQYQDLAQSFQPFMSDLRDIEAYLGTDLTAAGINAIKGEVRSASQNGEAVQEDIMELAEQFRSMGLRMAAPRPPAS